MIFEWDATKAQTNLSKHGVAFEEAVTVFNDPLAVIVPDEWHSSGEPREIIIGYSIQRRLLFIAFVERNDRVRVISAREATRKERKDYETYANPK